MTKKEYKSWIMYFLAAKSQKAQRLFLQSIDMDDELRMRGINSEYHMESSFDSQNKTSLLKAIHIFRYSKDYQKQRFEDLINFKSIKRLINNINRISGSGYNHGILTLLSGVLLSCGNKNDIIVFYVDYNLFTHKLDKISIHMKPAEESGVRKIARFLKVENLNATFHSLKDLEFIGIDFCPDGGYIFKTYQNLKVTDFKLYPDIKNDHSDLLRNKNIKSCLLMTRFNVNYTSSKNIYFYCEDIDCNQILDFYSAGHYGNFIKEVKPIVKNFFINWVSFKENKMEIYFR